MFSSKKKNELLRKNWGKPIIRYRDMELIANYHNSLPKESDENLVDNKTWNDLDFDTIFAIIDRSTSGIGQQYLYHLLHKYETEAVLKKRFELVSFFKEDNETREKVQNSLSNLSGVPSYFISYLVLCKSLPYTKYYKFFYLLSVLLPLSLILISASGIFLFVALSILVGNVIINKIYSNQIYQFYSGFSSFNSLLNSAIKISKIPTEKEIEELELLKKKRELLKSIKKKLGYLVIDKESLNELAVVVIEYLNLFFLFDLIAYNRSVNSLLKYRENMHEVFKAVAGLDAAISIASYLQETKNYSNPVFNNSGTISFEDMYHPLIKDAVPNSLRNIDKSVLITGSNMSGKTTFIKTFGVNMILSQTLYISLSNTFNIPRYEVKTSIKRNEEMEEGKSYFFVEIEAIKQFINLSGNRNKFIFLIDEIFRGTNTIERLSASTAVLKYLNVENKVFVTTHDIELQELLHNSFYMYHFSEQVEEKRFFFNYKINEGPCTAGNAIKLLEITGYPEKIINEANSIVNDILLSNYGVKGSRGKE